MAKSKQKQLEAKVICESSFAEGTSLHRTLMCLPPPFIPGLSQMTQRSASTCRMDPCGVVLLQQGWEWEILVFLRITWLPGAAWQSAQDGAMGSGWRRGQLCCW